MYILQLPLTLALSITLNSTVIALTVDVQFFIILNGITLPLHVFMGNMQTITLLGII